VRFEGNRFVYDPLRDEYRLSIDFSFPARDCSVHASFSFRPQHRFDYRLDTAVHDGVDFRHQWVLSVPKAGVLGVLDLRSLASGKREVLQFRGRGYHDHNLGIVPMYESIDRWYWGRIFSERYDMIYYVVFLRGRVSKPQAVMLVHDHQSGRQSVFDGVSVSEDGFMRGLFAPLHASRLRLQSGPVSIEVTHRRALDAGPFYLRYTSDVTVDVAGERFERIGGISEFLNPAPLNSKLMQFFTASRVWRAGKQSVMYTLYNYFKHRFAWFDRINRKKL
jgi:carotenoid 1,2-hydratase